MIARKLFCDNDPTWSSQGPIRGVFCLGVGQGSDRFTSLARKALLEVVQQILGLEVQTFILLILGLEAFEKDTTADITSYIKNVVSVERLDTTSETSPSTALTAAIIMGESGDEMCQTIVITIDRQLSSLKKQK